MTRLGLIESIKKYSTAFPEEEKFKNEFLTLLDHPRSFHRDHLPGHITGSSWIVNENFSRVLMIFHAKLNRWLQPGGHADGQEDVANVALREAVEETGITKFINLLPSFFDLDIHAIPTRKDFPEHYHYDIRFLLQASESEKLMISDESVDLRWVDIGDIDALTKNNQSIARMVAKTFNFALRQAQGPER
jgi:8-oxo-dGTP pyrophosphatase MutT (NUDIX family)